MGKHVAISNETNVPRFVRQLADRINLEWRISANAYRVSENEWRIVVMHKSGRSYDVKIIERNNVLSVNVEESLKSSAKNVLGSLAVVAIGLAIGTRNSVGRNLMTFGGSRELVGNSLYKKIERIVENFTDTYF